MYCKNCNAFNEDGNRFCASCGAPLNAEPQRPAEPPLQGQYVPPQGAYQQPFYGAQPSGELSRPLSIALPVIALIVGILTVNLIGILLGAFALVNFNRYTDAVRAGDFAAAETFKGKSRRLAVAGIVVTVVLTLIMIVFLVAGVAIFGFRVVENGGIDAPLVQFNGDSFTAAPYEAIPDVPAMLHALF